MGEHVSYDELDWRDESLGARVRVALWLRDEVGEGGIFHKQEMRAVIKGTEQVDRRMRDLRPAGWLIRTYRDKPSLQPDQLYLEKIGQPVWDPEHRAAGLRQISAKVRRAVYEKDGHMCRRCGIAAGEEYADEPGSRARLTLGHVTPRKHGGGVEAADLITECARCNEMVRHLTGVQMNAEQVWDRMTALSGPNMKLLMDWIAVDRRHLGKAEEVWALYRQLPAEARGKLAGDLEHLLKS
ncbi:HNH endonuclease [Streptomyces sp. NPDC094448]|uniref:HNH endonuclease n=1 Tax=Streptomyces sp. NPDC094448 TaxID=3366063 RepID=UPI00381A9BE7